MIFNVHGGHNSKVTGASGILNELTEDRKIKNLVISKLRNLGHTVYDCTDEVGATQARNLTNIVNKCNAHKVDLDISIHLNAGGGTGVEVLVYSKNGSSTAAATRICQEISKLGFPNRGVKERTNLYVLKHTNSPSLLVECCFVDNQSDANRYNAEKVASAIVSGVLGQSANTATSSSNTTSASTTTTASSAVNSGNNKIIEFQKWLNSSYGQKLTTDGIWGAKTKKAAIYAFQSELKNSYGKSIAVDGIWGARTKTACVNIKQGARGNIVKILQGCLYAFGYDPKGFDGIFGSGCTAAAKKYQGAKGLTTDGVIGKNTWAKIFE